MDSRVKAVIGFLLFAAAFSITKAAATPSSSWFHFSIYLLAVLLSSGFKVAMPRGEGTASVNFPFILLGILQLSPAQAIALAALSVFAQCRIRVIRPFTIVQIAFNVANATTATMMAWWTYMWLTGFGLALAPAIAFAATAYFFANTISVAFVIGWSKGESPFKLWRKEFPWYLPFYLVGAVLAALAQLIGARFGWSTSMLLVPVIYTIYRAYRAQMNTVKDRERHIEEMEALHLRTIEGLAMAIEAKDHDTHEHLRRVRVYVSEIGTALELDKQQMQALQTAAFLHDIGKLAVPEHIINKPGKLTQEEFEKIKIHPIVGADILERVRFPYPVVPIVRSHHEAWDGTGYPDGLKGNEIPIGARILSAVDCFDALASDRPYRKALPLAEAMAHIKSKSGSQFDPGVVRVLEERYIELEGRARTEVQRIEPLNTEISVQRGEAPGAGFQEDNAGAMLAWGDGSVRPAHKTDADDSRTRFESLSLIAAASQEAQAIFEMSQLLGRSLSPNETISVMSSRLRELIPFACFSVYLKTADSLSPQYMDGLGARSFTSAQIAIGEGLSGWVAQSGRPILNGNPKVEPNYEAGRDVSLQMNSALSLPLFDLNGNIFGVLTLYSAITNAFSRDHLRILQAVESKFSLSLQNALQFRSAEKDARIDFVTQLPNIRQFFFGMEAELSRAQASGERLAVIVCDLNSFKAVNDQQGHLTGNLLLRAIADGFRRCCRSSDTVARMGGDEFVFLLPGLDSGTFDSRMEDIEATVRQACRDLKIDIEVSTSIGAAFFPEDGQTAEELLGSADRRMYSHKRRHYEILEKAPQKFRIEAIAAA